MKRILLLLLIPLHLYGEYNPTILSVDNEYPIEINAKNKEKIAVEHQDVEGLLNSKRFPWEYILGPILFGLLYLIARQQPEKPVDYLEIQMRQRNIAKNKAMDLLKKLKDENYPDDKRFEEFYNYLTFIVRKYIEDYYSLPATTETTEEFLRNIAVNPVFDKSTEADLAEFLKSADVVKFSDHTPTVAECTQAQKTAENFITSGTSSV